MKVEMHTPEIYLRKDLEELWKMTEKVIIKIDMEKIS